MTKKLSRDPGPANPPLPPKPPLSEMAKWGLLWLWGSILLFTPLYLGIAGGWRWPFNVLGFTAIILSLGGALFELQSLRKNEAYGYWGMAAVFLAPAFLLHWAVARDYFATPLEKLVKVAVLVLILLGASLFVISLPHLFQKAGKEAKEITREERASNKEAKRRADFRIIVPAIIATLSLLTAVLKFISDFRNK